VDSLGLLFALVASFFGLVSILYSVGDMKEREGVGRYYALMLIFSGSMVGLFLADNFLLLFYFWEIVGLCSYFLIGFDYSRESSRASAKALLITNYAGAFLLVGILLLYFSTGTLQVSEVGVKLKEPVVVTLVALLFLLAALAKSAQFPLHVWLPDATVAPSAVTAYLHAAAMVKAGVYLVARSYVVFSNYLPIVSYEFVVATIGVVTLIVGTMAAWVQQDVKRILAFSTVGQTGYIFLGIGLGTTLGVVGGLFHILNHSAFKVSLFLCAGNPILQTGTRSIRKMGGIAKKMPLTAFSFTVASLAMAGIPPFNGFWSKLLVYYAGVERNQLILTVLAVFASCVTLAYVVRATHMIFFGDLPMEYADLRERLDWMTLPPLALSMLCIITGVFPELGLQIVKPVAQALLGLISRF